MADPSAQPDGTHFVEFRFAGDDPTFAGHFPGNPLLPGVFQLEMIRFATEHILDSRLAVLEITRAKFLRPILPDQLVRVRITRSTTNEKIDVRADLFVEGQAVSDIRMLLARR